MGPLQTPLAPQKPEGQVTAHEAKIKTKESIHMMQSGPVHPELHPQTLGATQRPLLQEKEQIGFSQRDPDQKGVQMHEEENGNRIPPFRPSM